MLKHISIVVLQNIETEIKSEAETHEDADVEHEQDVTYHFVPLLKVEGKVKISVLLYTIKV